MVFSLISFLLMGMTVLDAQIKSSYFNDYKFYTDENGLPSTYITIIQEDKYGFLWIATGNGISRFDGHHFTNFTHYTDDSLQHKIGNVKSIVFDRSGERVWVGCSENLLYSSVDSIHFQPVEKLIPSMKGMNLTNADLLPDEMKNEKFLLNKITCMTKDPAEQQVLWIGTTAGLVKFNNKSNEYQVYIYGDTPEMAQNKIRDIRVSDNVVFLGTWSEGLIILDKKTGQLHQIQKDEDDKLNKVILDLYQDTDSTLWITTGKGLMWGFGPIIELPTGGSIRGSQKWSVGPSLVLMAQPGDWTVGALINNAWSIAGNSDRGDINHMMLNAFVVRQLGGGWYVNSAPIITADWTADSEDRWIVPLGGGGGKLIMLGGKIPLNLQTQLYYNVVQPDFGPEWQWRVQAQVLLPTSIFKGSK